MKKIILLCLCVSLVLPAFSGTYEEYLSKARAHEVKKEYIYALGYYYDAMQIETSRKEASKGFDSVSSRLKKGSKGLELGLWDDPQEAWDKLLIEFYRYFTEFPPYDFYYSGKLERGELDYKSKTATYLMDCDFELSSKFKTMCEILTIDFYFSNEVKNYNWYFKDKDFIKTTYLDHDTFGLKFSVERNEVRWVPYRDFVFNAVDVDKYEKELIKLNYQCQQEIKNAGVDIYYPTTKDLAISLNIQSKYNPSMEKLKEDCYIELNNEILKYYKQSGVALAAPAKMSNTAFPASFVSLENDVYFRMSGNYIPYEIQFGLYDDKGNLLLAGAGQEIYSPNNPGEKYMYKFSGITEEVMKIIAKGNFSIKPINTYLYYGVFRSSGYKTDSSEQEIRKSYLENISKVKIEQNKIRISTEKLEKQKRLDLQKAQRDKEDEGIIAKILSLEIQNVDGMDELQYGDYDFQFNATGYGYSPSSQSLVRDNIRMYAILNRASEKAGYSPCYYQVQNDECVFDCEKWQIGEWNRDTSRWEIMGAYSKEDACSTIYYDEAATGFRYYSDGYNSYIYRKDDNVLAEIEAKLKAQRDKEDEKFIAELLALEISEVYSSGELRYGNYNFQFNAKGYDYPSSSQSVVEDEFRVYAILNKASEKAGYSPCYYQEQGGKRIFDSDKWNLGKWDGTKWKNAFSECYSILCDETSNGFCCSLNGYNSYTYRIYRKDAKVFAEIKASEKAQQNKEDEKFVAEILGLELHIWPGSNDMVYCEYEKFSNFRDKARIYAIMNKASEKAGYSPCYYQEQGGEKIFDSDKWDLGEWGYYSWEKIGTIKYDELANGFYGGGTTIYRKDINAVVEIEKKLKMKRNKEDESFIEKILALKMNGLSESEELQYGYYRFEFDKNTYTSSYYSSVSDMARVYAIMNKASEKAGFSPCYYQEPRGEKIFDSDKWELGKWSHYGGWEKKENIKRDELANGFYYKDFSIYRKDPAAIVEIEKKLRIQRSKEDEKFVEKILALKIISTGSEYERYEDCKFIFNASNYSRSSGAVWGDTDTVRVYAILNKASEKAGYSPCYYQEQDGEKIFDSDKWNLGKWNPYSGWEKTNTINHEKSANGYYQLYGSYIYRNNSKTSAK